MRWWRSPSWDTNAMGLALSPEEGFLLSRLDTPLGLQELVELTGLALARVEAILDLLGDKGLVETDTPSARPAVGTIPDLGSDTDPGGKSDDGDGDDDDEIDDDEPTLQRAPTQTAKPRLPPPVLPPRTLPPPVLPPLAPPFPVAPPLAPLVKPPSQPPSADSRRPPPPHAKLSLYRAPTPQEFQSMNQAARAILEAKPRSKSTRPARDTETVSEAPAADAQPVIAMAAPIAPPVASVAEPPAPPLPELTPQPASMDVGDREPIAIAAPAREPIAIAIPPREPFAIAVPAREPIAIAAPPREPIAIAAPPREPIAIAAPAREPIAIAAPAREPIAIAAPAAPEQPEPIVKPEPVPIARSEPPPNAVQSDVEAGGEELAPTKTNTIAPMPMLEAYALVINPNTPESTRESAREWMRNQFLSASPEQRANFIFDTEGHTLPVFVGIPFDARVTSILCTRVFTSQLLVQNLARFTLSPSALLTHLLRQVLVRRSPQLRRMVLNHPNLPMEAKRRG